MSRCVLALLFLIAHTPVAAQISASNVSGSAKLYGSAFIAASGTTNVETPFTLTTSQPTGNRTWTQNVATRFLSGTTIRSHASGWLQATSPTSWETGFTWRQQHDAGPQHCGTGVSSAMADLRRDFVFAGAGRFFALRLSTTSTRGFDLPYTQDWGQFPTELELRVQDSFLKARFNPAAVPAHWIITRHARQANGTFVDSTEIVAHPHWVRDVPVFVTVSPVITLTKFNVADFKAQGLSATVCPAGTSGHYPNKNDLTIVSGRITIF